MQVSAVSYKADVGRKKVHGIATVHKDGWDLSGELTKLWDRSYMDLIDKGLVSHLDGGFGSGKVSPPPLGHLIQPGSEV